MRALPVLACAVPRGYPSAVIPPRSWRLALGVLSLSLLGSCASLEFDRETATSGTFRSSAWCFTFLSFDLPSPAVVVARNNAADAGQPNTEATYQKVVPYLGWFDFLLEIVGVRYAVVKGTWGYPDAAPARAEAAR